MLAEVPLIPLWRLAVALAPMLVVIGILWRWSLSPWEGAYATLRMLVQLFLIGYALTFLFHSGSPVLIGLVLTVMLLAASWIAVRSVKNRTASVFLKALGAIAIGGGATLLLVTQGVLAIEPWFEARYVVPLAGMIFANAMNALSLSAERFESERAAGNAYPVARNTAMRAAMIPQTNTLLAVGLVSIPGMMTGQILAEEDPLIAARYQIMVMAMVYGSAGISAACFLTFLQPAKRASQDD